ncbi:hypothetical protein HAX54_053029 [Datura stramonium]|uniref:Uncharacterized protein n=1 Tax=Datura stramonium TaxID=4076 RepID=A0ABS8WU09_DATST|nr:hypothetical protein [Datura stramonium]
MEEVTEHHLDDGPSHSPSLVTMPPKFQPTRGGARKRTDRTETAHHLQDENVDSKGEIQEIRTEEPSSGYQTRSIARQQAANHQSDEGDNSLEDGSSSSGMVLIRMKGVALRPPTVQ